MAGETPLLVCAIDFGTTYSGWAYSWEYDPKKIYNRSWISPPCMVTAKAPTTLLVKPDGKTFDSFGFDATKVYASLTSDEKRKYFYFHRFKMRLYEEMIDRSWKMNDESGKPLPAKMVFSLAIRFLKDDMFGEVKKAMADIIEMDDIMWVLTVPAIWNDAAKQFMHEAAIEAGIDDTKIMIALEPEAASIFCQLMPLHKMGTKIESFRPGSKYMVMDAGGGTVDITVHEVLDGGRLKELYKASGGGWGGTQVDKAFGEFIVDLIGIQKFKQIQKDNINEYIDLFNFFEVSKRTFSQDDTMVKIPIPSSFRYAIQEATHAEMMTFLGDNLEIKASTMKAFFSGSIGQIVSHVAQMMTDNSVNGISFILMVGGYSESKFLQREIESTFPGVKVIVPPEAGLTVLRGAVMYGFNPSVISHRVCKYTYGVGTCRKFDSKEHDEKKKVMYDDVLYCSDIFDRHVKIGQTVTFNEVQSERSYFPVTEDQQTITFGIYGSSKRSTKYVTDTGCVKLGTVTLNISDRSVPRQERNFNVSMIFSGTEIEVFAKENRARNSKKVSVNFLEMKSESMTSISFG